MCVWAAARAAYRRKRITIADVFHASEEKAALGMSVGIALALVILETVFRRWNCLLQSSFTNFYHSLINSLILLRL